MHLAINRWMNRSIDRYLYLVNSKFCLAPGAILLAINRWIHRSIVRYKSYLYLVGTKFWLAPGAILLAINRWIYGIRNICR